MKRKTNNKGLTLVEIIVALAIIGILAVSFLPVFSASFKWVTDAGKKSDQIYENQNITENKILDGSSTTAVNMDMTFKDSLGGVDVVVSVPGENVVNGSLQLFLPN